MEIVSTNLTSWWRFMRSYKVGMRWYHLVTTSFLVLAMIQSQLSGIKENGLNVPDGFPTDTNIAMGAASILVLSVILNYIWFVEVARGRWIDMFQVMLLSLSSLIMFVSAEAGSRADVDICIIRSLINCCIICIMQTGLGIVMIRQRLFFATSVCVSTSVLFIPDYFHSWEWQRIIATVSAILALVLLILLEVLDRSVPITEKETDEVLSHDIARFLRAPGAIFCFQRLIEVFMKRRRSYCTDLYLMLASIGILIISLMCASQRRITTRNKGSITSLQCHVDYISREIRAPLGSMLMGIEYMQTTTKDPRSSKLHELLHDLQATCDRALQGVDNFVDYQNLKELNVQLKLRMVVANTIMTMSLKRFSFVAQNFGIMLVVKIPTEILARHSIFVDSKYFEQAFRNLLLLAVQYSSTGSIVRVTCTREDIEMPQNLTEETNGIFCIEIVSESCRDTENISALLAEGSMLEIELSKLVFTRHNGSVKIRLEGESLSITIQLPCYISCGSESEERRHQSEQPITFVSILPKSCSVVPEDLDEQSGDDSHGTSAAT